MFYALLINSHVALYIVVFVYKVASYRNNYANKTQASNISPHATMTFFAISQCILIQDLTVVDGVL